MNTTPLATLTATDPAGGYHQIHTADSYTWAGFAKDVAGNWILLTQGFSPTSVQADTHAEAHRRVTFLDQVTVARFRTIDETATPQAITDHFTRSHPAAAGKPLTLAGLFYQGQGWLAAAPGQPFTAGELIRYRSGPVVPTVVAVTDGTVTANFLLCDLAA